MRPLVRSMPRSRRREGQTRIGQQALWQHETSPSVCLDANPGCNAPTSWLQRVSINSLRTLQSRETHHSYANIEHMREHYQSVPVSSQIVGQTRPLPTLRHKTRFAVAGHCHYATAIHGHTGGV
jgi:hypothetical protein